MELGIFAKTFRRPDARQTLEAVRALGLRSVQFNFECAGLPSMPKEVPAPVLAAIADSSRETKVRLAALSATFNMAHPGKEVRQEGLRRLPVVAEAAARLQIPLLTLCTGSRDRENIWRAHPENRSPQAWADLLETMEVAMQISGQAGIALAIEPEPGNVVSDARRAYALKEELRAGELLKIILDPANLLQAGRSQHDVLDEAFDLLGEDLAIAHAKDRDGDDQTCALGRGIVDFETFFGLLHSVGFTGPVIMHGFDESDAAESTRFVRAKLREVIADALS
jgi:sugar phosphate isomerase/epimerase